MKDIKLLMLSTVYLEKTVRAHGRLLFADFSSALLVERWCDSQCYQDFDSQCDHYVSLSVSSVSLFTVVFNCKCSYVYSAVYLPVNNPL